MGEPKRKRCLTPWLVPHGASLRKSVVRGRHLLLHFPKLWSDSSVSALVNRLRGELPENYEVFDGGALRHWKRVTVMEVISREEVSTITPAFMKAARRFRADAGLLAQELARLNKVQLAELSSHDKNITVFPEEWEVYAHGIHFCFTHRTTGQRIEVCTMFGDEFGVLDPYFFYQFMATTPGVGLPKQIVEPYHDTRRAMDLLAANESLKRITRSEWATGL